MNRKILLGIAFVIAIASGGFCQKLPNMYVPKSISEPRIANFYTGPNSKHQKLKTILPNITDSFIYSIAEVKTLLSKIDTAAGLRVFFAVYNDCLGYSLPATAKNRLILLFSPGYEKTRLATEQFFYIDENDKKDSVYEIKESDCIRQWMTNYSRDAIQKILVSTLIPNDPDNVDPNVSGKYFDTESIFYPRDSLEQAITLEQTYPHILKSGQRVNIDYLKFSFAAFDNVGQFPPDPSGHRWRNRILLYMDYMYKSGTQKKIFHFEDLNNFDDRVTQTLVEKFGLPLENLKSKSRKEKIKILGKKGIDNGQLCPTNCPPPPPPSGN